MTGVGRQMRKSHNVEACCREGTLLGLREHARDGHVTRFTWKWLGVCAESDTQWNSHTWSFCRGAVIWLLPLWSRVNFRLASLQGMNAAAAAECQPKEARLISTWWCFLIHLLHWISNGATCGSCPKSKWPQRVNIISQLRPRRPDSATKATRRGLSELLKKWQAWWEHFEGD